MANNASDKHFGAQDATRGLETLDGTLDARARRPGPPPELDATRPMQARPARANGNAARPLSQPRAAAPAAPLKSAPTSRETRQWRLASRIGRRAWWAAGAAVVLGVAFVLYLARPASPGFAIVVNNAPPNSDIYVDTKRYGVTSSDGKIRVTALKAGTRVVRVSHEGYEDFNSSVKGRDGETHAIDALMKQAAKPAPQGLPAEIDYNGPMVLIPAGEFVMGDDTHEPNERPVHKVTLPDYYIDKYEVTNAQYKRFADETRREYPTRLPEYKEAFLNNPDWPVIGVSWEDAVAYAKWAGKRLPTEQDWEKAVSWDPSARAKRQRPWGDAPDPRRANLSGRPGAVGRFSDGVSAYGVHDGIGGAAEWVDAWYQPYPGNQVPDPDYGTRDRIARGGGFTFHAEDARTTVRKHYPADRRAGDVVNGEVQKTSIGFRCAVSADDPQLQQYLRRRAAGQ